MTASKSWLEQGRSRNTVPVTVRASSRAGYPLLSGTNCCPKHRLHTCDFLEGGHSVCLLHHGLFRVDLGRYLTIRLDSNAAKSCRLCALYLARLVQHLQKLSESACKTQSVSSAECLPLPMRTHPCKNDRIRVSASSPGSIQGM